MLWWVGFRRRFMYAASTVRMDLHNSFASCHVLIMWPSDTRDTVSTTTSSDQTCTGSCRRRSTLDTCRTCPTAFSWFAISIDIWCMSLSTLVSSGTVMKSFQLAIAPWFIRVYHAAGFGSTGFLQFSVLCEVHLRLDQVWLSCAWGICCRTETCRNVWINNVRRFELVSFMQLS